MRIRFLGTGNAFNQDGRGSPGILLEPRDASPFLVDPGPTVMQALAGGGGDCAAVDRVFVTHLHGDHTAGWPFLMLHWVFLAQRRRPVRVFGPRGVRDRLETLARACYPEALERRQFELHYEEWDVGEAHDVAAGEGLRLDLLPMDHHPSSTGLRFRIDDGSVTRPVAVSGDTGWCANLERLAEHSELLVVECTGARRVAGGHLSLEELREGLERLGAERIVLVHLTDEVAEQLALDPLPRVTAAFDGMSLELGDDEAGEV